MGIINDHQWGFSDPDKVQPKPKRNSATMIRRHNVYIGPRQSVCHFQQIIYAVYTYIMQIGITYCRCQEGITELRTPSMPYLALLKFRKQEFYYTIFPSFSISLGFFFCYHLLSPCPSLLARSVKTHVAHFSG